MSAVYLEKGTRALFVAGDQIGDFRPADTVDLLYLAADFRRETLRLFVIAMFEFDLQVQISAVHHPNDTIRYPAASKP